MDQTRNVHYDLRAECSGKINSFLSHLNTKLRLLPVFRLKLHWLSGVANGPVADLVHGAEPMARQTIKKPISGQGGPLVRRPIFGLNCEILHLRQVGGRAVVVVAAASLRGLAAGRRSSTASEVKVPIQPLCCDTISKHRSSSTAPAANRPRNVCQAKLLSPTAAKRCHWQTAAAPKL